jgi:TolA-binding protein
METAVSYAVHQMSSFFLTGEIMHNIKKKIGLICSLWALLTLSGCMTSQRQDQLQGSIDRLQAQIFDLQNQIASRDQQISNTTQSALSSQSNLDDLKSQLQLTQGDVDELKSKIKKMEQTAAPTAGVATLQNPPPASIPSEILRKIARVDLMVDDILNHPRKGKLPGKIKNNNELAKALKNEYESGNFKEVINISSAVLNAQTATSAMISSALQYRGDSKFQLQDYRGAAIDLGLYVENYPNGQKYSRALLIAGDCYVYLKMNNVARTYYEEGARAFPTTPEGKAASGRLASLDAQLHGTSAAPVKSKVADSPVGAPSQVTPVAESSSN